jgi:serine/threonine-protein kinase HipA
MDALAVSLSDVKIGILERFEDERHCFSFCKEYIDSFLKSRPVLGQIFEDRFPNSIFVDGPICWFVHLLPQGVMLRWRSNLLSIDEHDTFELLAHLGDDLPGAIKLTPCESELRSTRPVSFRKEHVTADESSFRFSLAGAQWKLSARSAGRGLTTAASSGSTAYIAKFHSPEYPGLPQCEFASMSWARAAGISTPEFSLRNVSEFDEIPEGMPTGDGTAFVIERFDRSSFGRIHIEDFGQILDRPPGQSQYHGSYEEIARVIKWIAPSSAVEFVKNLVFHVIAGNGDAHLKNFSMMYPDTRNAVLSPAYDIVSTVLYVTPGKEELALTLAGQKKFKSVSLASFNQLFESLGWEQHFGRQVVTDFTEAAFDAWRQNDIRLNFSKLQVDRLQSHIDSLALASE